MVKLGGTSKWWLWFPLGIILGGILVVVVPAVSDQLQRWLTRDGLDLLWKIAVLLCLIRLNLKR